MHATGEDWYLGIALAVAAAGKAGVAATVPVLVSNSTFTAEVLSGDSNIARTELQADDSIGVYANLDANTFLFAGGIAAGGNAGVGITISTAVLKNEVYATVGDYVSLIASGNFASGSVTDAGIKTPNREERRRGVIISATAGERIIMGSVSAAAGGTAGVSGVINTLVVRNIVKATMGDNFKVEANGDAEGYTATLPNQTTEQRVSTADFTVEADDESFIINLAGALAAGGTAGVGATVVVLVFNKDVHAYVGELNSAKHVKPGTGDISADGSVSVTANAKDDLWLLALAFGAGGTAGVAGDVNALVFQNCVIAALGGEVTAGGDVTVRADSEGKLYNIGAGVAVGGTAGVAAVAVVTYFYNSAEAYVTASADVTAQGDILVGAYSNEFVTSDAAGLAGGGTVGVGGTLDIVITKVTTRAFTEEFVKLIATGDVTVQAVDFYELIAIVVTAAGGGTAGVGLTVLVSISYNTIGAAIGVNNTVSGTNVSVTAASNRDVLTVAGSIAGGGVAGVGATISVVLVGSKPDKDTHDSIYPDKVQMMAKVGDDSYAIYNTKKDLTGDKLTKKEEDGKYYYLSDTDRQYKSDKAYEQMVSVEAQQVA